MQHAFVIKLDELRDKIIPIGFVGENLYKSIVFVCDKVFGEYPNAIPALTLAYVGHDPFPVIVTRDGDNVVWNVTSNDLSYSGDGEIQLTFVQDSVVKKSFIGHVEAARSLMPKTPRPSSIDDWITAAEAVIGEIPETIMAALQEAKESGEFDGVGIESIEKTSTSGLVDTYTITFTNGDTKTFDVTNGRDGIDGKDGKDGADGKDGTDGEDGVGISSIVKTSTSGLVDTYTITMTNGDTATFTVTNGRDGESPIIDVNGIVKCDGQGNLSAAVAGVDFGTYSKPNGGIPAEDIASGVIPDITGKADKVTGATSGNFAGLDSNGNLVDSGKKASDFVSPSEISGFYTKPAGGIPADDIASGVIPDISGKLDATQKGVANGVAELDSSGKVPSAQLPSYVDDVINGYYYNSKFYEESTHTTEIAGESGKIYVDLDSDTTYRWSGSAFVPIKGDLTLGETSSTAYRGDRGKAAYDHAVAKGSAYTSGLYKITTNAEGHVTAATDVVKADITALGIPGEQPDITGKLDKIALNNAGITNRTETELFGGEFSVTTATGSGHSVPYALAAVTGRLYADYGYKVTFDGTEYDLPAQLWYSRSGNSGKVYEYIGKLSLFTSVTGNIDEQHNVPFLIVSDYVSSQSIEIWTESAGTHTFTIEKCEYAGNAIPRTLIYGTERNPIFVDKASGTTYAAYSIGVNSFTDNKRGSMAFGFVNDVSHMSTAIGIMNDVKGGDNNYVVGSNNNVVKGTGAHVFGHGNTIGNSTIQTLYGNAFGNYNIVNGYYNTAIGNLNDAGSITSGGGTSMYNTLVGTNNKLYKNVRYAVALGSVLYPTASHSVLLGTYNVQDTQYPDWEANHEYAVGDKVSDGPDGYICKNANSDSSFTAANWDPLPCNGEYLLILGNGASAPSNAMVVDQFGTAKFAGDVYVGCNNDSTGGTKLVKGTDYATDSAAGVVKVNSQFGLWVRSSPNQDTIMISKAAADTIKSGVQNYQPIVPSYQKYAVFYGLAEAAGDTTQKNTSATPANEIGTYTSAAKAAIQTMLGVEAGVSFTENVSGSTPTISALPNVKYKCGEVSTLTITAPASGTVDVWFTSGSTATLLTTTGVVFPEWFDPTELEIETVYELIITDGFAEVATWARPVTA